MGHFVSKKTRRKIGIAGLGRDPWNKGLTKDDHPSILRASNLTRGRVASEEERLHVSEALKKYWASLYRKEKAYQMQLRLGKARCRPNKSERLLSGYLEELDFCFNSVPLSPSHRVPDFLHREEPLIIEFDGGGGHNPRLPWVPENKPELDNLRDQEYRLLGYKVLRLHKEDLLAGETHVQTIVHDWTAGGV